MSRKVSPFAIGVFVMGALVIFLGAFLVLFRGNFSSNGMTFVLYFNSSLNGLDVGSPVKFKGVRVGSVRKIEVAYDAESSSVLTPVIVEIDATIFSPSAQTLSKVDRGKFYQSQMMSGLAAKLSMESFVTGKLFVELDYYRPNKLRFYVKNKTSLSQIPTVASEIEKFISGADNIIRQFSKVDLKTISRRLVSILSNVDEQLQGSNLKELIHNISNASMSVQNFFTSDKMRGLIERFSTAMGDVQAFLGALAPIVERFEGSIGVTAKDISRASQKFSDTCEHVSGLIGPHSDFRESAKECLQQATKALRLLRCFLDLLNRTPNALFAGINYEEN
ncbi:MAG: MlaD family protein [Puniceicoccales bacterium]|nr:MlaD family protein [Puniceicoccales bacterium]